MPNNRFQLIGLPAEKRLAKFARDVKQGLTASPKRLPCCYFYDRLGSLLFEAICETPEYYLTRTETALLQAHADEIAALADGPLDLIELGSGNATKTRLLIDALLGRGVPLRYVPIDICRTILEESSRILLEAYPGLEVLAVSGEYHESLAFLGSTGQRAKLALWLGSNIGNLERSAAARFLAHVRTTLALNDRILVGIDMRKDRATLEAAYDDACGVTVAFNRNILVRINRELGGSFEVHAFRHRAVYNEDAGRIEMYLVSATRQQARIASLDLEVSFAAGEAIHTENSHKYSAEEIQALAQAAGLHCERRWENALPPYRLNLFSPVH